MSGLPGGAGLGRVVVRDGVWVAVGTVQGDVTAGDRYDIAVWRSSDGLVWDEAFRRSGRRIGPTPGAGLTATSDGFTVAGTVCGDERCEPFGAHSEDGRRWRSASIPAPVTGGDSSADDVASANGAGRELVAVGLTLAEQGVGDAPAGPALWTSEDAGRSWQSLPASVLPGSAAVKALDRVETVRTSVVVHGLEETGNGSLRDALWGSGDGGRQWSRIPLPDDAVGQTPLQLARDVGDALVLVGARGQAEPSLWRSDNLSHWSAARRVPSSYAALLDAGEGYAFARGDAYDATSGRLRVWGSHGGSRFGPVYESGPLEGPSVQSVVWSDGRAFVYATVGTGGLRHFLRWEADGRCAVARCGPPPPIGVAGDVTGYRAEPVPVLFGERLLVADDDGGYADVTPGRVAESAQEHVHDAVFLDRDHGWAVTVNVDALASWVLRTVDGGRTWAQTSHQGGFSHHAGTSLRVTAVDPDHAWLVYIVPPSGSPGGIARTTDGGRTWSAGGELPISGDVRFTDRLHGFLAADFAPGGGGLYVTDDGGVTWEERTVALPDGVTLDEARFGLPRFFGSRGVLPVGIVEPSRSRVAFHVSADGGATWTPAAVAELPPGSWGAQAKVASPHEWWAADKSGAFVATTVDSGRTWTGQRPAGVDGLLGIIDARDGMTAVAGERTTVRSRLLVTHDAGASWAPFPSTGERRSGPACPSLGPARLPDTAESMQLVKGDLDGDGRADRLVL